jgi:hypothetical protein
MGVHNQLNKLKLSSSVCKKERGNLILFGSSARKLKRGKGNLLGGCAWHPKKAFMVCNKGRPRVHEDIPIEPWRYFLAILWNGLRIL